MSAEIKRLITQINRYIQSDVIDRRVLSAVHSAVTIRAFKDGKYADGRSLGDYSPEYQKVRAKKGINQTKKVNLQFTGQMLKDFKLIVLGNDEYGSGFNNVENMNKSEWVEDLYRGSIFDLGEKEIQLLETLYEKELSANID